MIIFIITGLIEKVANPVFALPLVLTYGKKFTRYP